MKDTNNTIVRTIPDRNLRRLKDRLNSLNDLPIATILEAIVKIVSSRRIQGWSTIFLLFAFSFLFFFFSKNPPWSCTPRSNDFLTFITLRYAFHGRLLHHQGDPLPVPSLIPFLRLSLVRGHLSSEMNFSTAPGKSDREARKGKRKG